MPKAPSSMISGPTRSTWTPARLERAGEGVLAAVIFSRDLPTTALGCLLPEERVYAEELPIGRRREWVAGRISLAFAFTELQQSTRPTPRTPFLCTEHGAPQLPTGMAGSVSHKHALAVAIMNSETLSIGVDVEVVEPMQDRFIDRVLTPTERHELPSDLELHESACLYFAVKEAIYKALPPLEQPSIDFENIELQPSTSLHLKNLWGHGVAHVSGNRNAFHIAWITDGLWILAIAHP